MEESCIIKGFNKREMIVTKKMIGKVAKIYKVSIYGKDRMVLLCEETFELDALLFLASWINRQ